MQLIDDEKQELQEAADALEAVCVRLAAKAQTVVETDEEQDWYRFGADDFDAVIRAHVKGILEAANVDGMCGCLLCCN